MELEHEQRRLRFYPRDFSAGNNSAPQKSKYHFTGPDGQVYLDAELLGEDLDNIFPEETSCDCKNCDKKNCERRKIEYQPAGNVLGADVIVQAVSTGLAGIGNIAQAFKKGEDAQAIRQKLKLLKEQCPKMPLLRITKAQKEKAKQHTDCVQAVVDKEHEFDLAMAGQGSSLRAGATPDAGKSNTALIIGIAAGAFLLILIIVIIILVIRGRRNAEGKK